MKRQKKIQLFLVHLPLLVKVLIVENQLDTCSSSPKSNIEQAVGRILRQEAKDRKFVPLVIDIVDEFSLFPKQGLKRIKFYQKNKYNIRQFGCDGEEIPMKTKRNLVPASELEFLPDSD